MLELLELGTVCMVVGTDMAVDEVMCGGLITGRLELVWVAGAVEVGTVGMPEEETDALVVGTMGMTEEDEVCALEMGAVCMLDEEVCMLELGALMLEEGEMWELDATEVEGTPGLELGGTMAPPPPAGGAPGALLVGHGSVTVTVTVDVVADAHGGQACIV